MKLVKKFLIIFEEQLKFVKKMKDFVKINQAKYQEIERKIDQTIEKQEQFAEFAFFQNYCEFLQKEQTYFRNFYALFQEIYNKANFMQQNIIDVFKQSKNIYKESKDVEEKKHGTLCQILIGKFNYLFKHNKKFKQDVKKFDQQENMNQKLNSILKLIVRHFNIQCDDLEDEIDKNLKELIQNLQKQTTCKNSKIINESSFDISQIKIKKCDNQLDFSSDFNSIQKEEIEKISQDLLSNENQDLISMTNTLKHHLSSNSEVSIQFQQQKVKKRRNTEIFNSEIRFKDLKKKETLDIQNEYDLAEIDVDCKSQVKLSHHNLKFLTIKETKQFSESRNNNKLQQQRQNLQLKGIGKRITKTIKVNKIDKNYQRKTSLFN